MHYLLLSLQRLLAETWHGCHCHPNAGGEGREEMEKAVYKMAPGGSAGARGQVG